MKNFRYRSLVPALLGASTYSVVPTYDAIYRMVIVSDGRNVAARQLRLSDNGELIDPATLLFGSSSRNATQILREKSAHQIFASPLAAANAANGDFELAIRLHSCN